MSSISYYLWGRLTVAELKCGYLVQRSKPLQVLHCFQRSGRRRLPCEQLRPGLHCPSLPLEVSPSSSFPHFFLLLSSQCIKCIILSHLAVPSRTAPLLPTHTLRAHARHHFVSETRNLWHQRVRLLSPCYLAWTTWPRVQRGARERGEEWEHSGRGERESSGENLRKKMWGRRCGVWRNESEERQMGPEGVIEGGGDKKVSGRLQCQERGTVVFGVFLLETSQHDADATGSVQ